MKEATTQSEFDAAFQAGERILVRAGFFVARGNSSVEAWGNSSVEARGNSSVVAWENSSVVAWGNVFVRRGADEMIPAVTRQIYTDSYRFHRICSAQREGRDDWVDGCGHCGDISPLSRTATGSLCAPCHAIADTRAYLAHMYKSFGNGGMV